MVFYLSNSAMFITFPSNEALEASRHNPLEKFDYDNGHNDGA